MRTPLNLISALSQVAQRDVQNARDGAPRVSAPDLVVVGRMAVIRPRRLTNPAGVMRNPPRELGPVVVQPQKCAGTTLQRQTNRVASNVIGVLRAHHKH